MPIYEYECEKHGRFEQISKQAADAVACPTCSLESPFVWSLVSMQPDNMWSGVNTQQGYFTSKEQHLSYLKNNSLERVERGMVEEVKKKAKNRLPEQLKKNEKNLEKFLGKELASM